MAADRVGRHARALEIEPRFVDVAIRRWQAFTRRDARHADSGLSFDEVEADSSRSGKFASRHDDKAMNRSSGRRRIRRQRRPGVSPPTSNSDPPDQDYRVGPGRPPKEYQFKPGQSGNPKGARRKPRSIAPDLKALFERALSGKVTLRQGEQEKIITKAAAGIEQLVNQFAKGDRHARRDLLALAPRLGVDLLAGQGEQGVAAALSANDEALLDDHVRRRAVELYRAGEIDAGSRSRLKRSKNRPGSAKNPIRRSGQ
jgi:hypothetical protein